jgi:hypothetical protein
MTLDPLEHGHGGGTLAGLLLDCMCPRLPAWGASASSISVRKPAIPPATATDGPVTR